MIIIIKMMPIVNVYYRSDHCVRLLDTMGAVLLVVSSWCHPVSDDRASKSNETAFKFEFH